jgi:hypothetical protein
MNESFVCPWSSVSTCRLAICMQIQRLFQRAKNLEPDLGPSNAFLQAKLKNLLQNHRKKVSLHLRTKNVAVQHNGAEVAVTTNMIDQMAGACRAFPFAIVAYSCHG